MLCLYVQLLAQQLIQDTYSDSKRKGKNSIKKSTCISVARKVSYNHKQINNINRHRTNTLETQIRKFMSLVTQTLAAVIHLGT
jgi:hypothetical protein